MTHLRRRVPCRRIHRAHYRRGCPASQNGGTVYAVSWNTHTSFSYTRSTARATAGRNGLIHKEIHR